MFEEILHEFVEKIKEKESEWFDQLKDGFSMEEVEREILDMVNDLFSRLMGSLLERVLEDKEILKKVRQFGGKLA
jgi:glutathionylspermidine synthase